MLIIYDAVAMLWLIHKFRRPNPFIFVTTELQSSAWSKGVIAGWVTTWGYSWMGGHLGLEQDGRPPGVIAGWETTWGYSWMGGHLGL